MKKAIATLALAVAFLPFNTASAAHHSMKDQLLKSLDGIEKKLVGLAEAVPDDKFSWSPMEGVRSFSAVFMHVASANYFIGSQLGPKPPEGVDIRGLEKNVTTKAGVVKELKASMAFARKAIESTSEEAMSESINLFGNESTKGGAALVIVEHGSEHLGQAIAYARMNKVVPPWSR